MFSAAARIFLSSSDPMPSAAGLLTVAFKCVQEGAQSAPSMADEWLN
jgi:hypothetical protein